VKSVAPAHPRLERHDSNSLWSSAKRDPYASRRARMTTSHGGTPATSCRRQTSRSHRRKRLRATAVDWNFGTISPTLGWPA